MKPITEYYKSNHSSSKDGYRFECKQCDKEIAAKSLRCKKAKQDNKYKKMGSLYKIKRGLIYKAIHGTKYVTYICLQCGKQHTTTWKLAHQAKFMCPSREYKKIQKSIPTLVSQNTFKASAKKCNTSYTKRRGRKKMSLWKRIFKLLINW